MKPQISNPEFFHQGSWRHICTALLGLLLGLAFGQSVQAERMTFEKGVSGWWVVLDGVMGGLSSGQVHALKTESGPGDSAVESAIRFSGVLSLENSGGFSQARKETSSEMFAGADGVKVRVRGDGRTYRFDLRAPVSGRTGWREGSYRQAFATEVGQWVDVVLPFDRFDYRWRGNGVSGVPPVDPSRITSLGFTLSDKNDGAFVLEVQSIEPWFEAQLSDMPAFIEIPQPKTEASTEVIRRLYLLAIDRGVPLFNAGQTQACASIYEVVIEAMLATEQSVMPPAVVALLNDGLVRAQSDRSWHDRAWTYRRALDGAYAQMGGSVAMPRLRNP